MTRRTYAHALLGVLLVGSLVGTPAAHADRLDELERRAAELVEQLEAELEAVRRERKALAAEREALEERTPEDVASETAAAPDDSTKRTVDVLVDEVAKIKEQIVVPEKAELKSEYGLGPAASKVYHVSQGLSLGGYGEGFFSGTVDDTEGTDNRADALRFVLYTGYKFTDRILLNAEIEFEHGTTGSTVSSGDGSVSLEFAYLDFLGNDWINARAGLVLVPIGFVNEMHEPLFFHGNNRPEVERQIIPSTWRELGVGLFGSLGDEVSYRGYVHTSFNAKGFSSSGLRGGRQKGNRALANDLGGSLRFDYEPRWLEGALLGGSAFVGQTTQDQEFAGTSSIGGLLALWDVHAQWRFRGLELRGLAVFGRLDDADAIGRDLGTPISRRYQGYYGEIAYDVMPHILPDLTNQALQPFIRYESYDTQLSVRGQTRGPDRTKDTELYTLGVSYKPHPQVVLKLDYRNFELARGERADDVNIGAGFVF